MPVTQGSVELLLALIVVVLVFGTGVVGRLAGTLGRGLRELAKVGLRQRRSRARLLQRGQFDVRDGSAR